MRATLEWPPQRPERPVLRDSFCDPLRYSLLAVCDIFAIIDKMKTVVLTAAAARQLDALPAQAQEQVIGALDAYAMTGLGDVKKLAARDGYRLRVGRYRVLFDEDQVTVIAVYVGKRETTTYGRN